MTKKCTKCGEVKDVSYFHKQRSNKTGYKSACKDCIKLDGKVFYLKNKDKIKKRDKLYYENNKEKCIAHGKTERVKKYQKKYREEHRQQRYEYGKQYRVVNKQKINDKVKIRKREDVNFRLAHDLRTVIGYSLKNGKKWFKMKELIGCDLDFFKQHIESMFTEGMTWENHARFGWHLDHIKPIVSFINLKHNKEQQKECFNWSNFQPLWWYDNLSKGAKIVA